MTIIIISDTHLTNEFDQKRFDFLKKIILESDQVIINGDFWDGYFVEFKNFIESSWRELFPFLKAKRTVYIFGNHDRREWADEHVNLYSVEQKEKHELRLNERIFHIEHGNKIAPVPDDIFPWFASHRSITSLLIRMGRQFLETTPGKSTL